MITINDSNNYAKLIYDGLASELDYMSPDERHDALEYEQRLLEADEPEYARMLGASPALELEMKLEQFPWFDSWADLESALVGE